MKKILLVIAGIMLFAAASPALAKTLDDIQAAIKSGDLSKINIIAAKNPSDQGDIAMYLLEQSQNASLSQDLRVKLYDAVAPFAGQIALSDATQASSIAKVMLNMANDPGFQKAHPKQAAAILATTLTISDQANILTVDPNLHDLAVADAKEYTENYPGEVDKRLQDEVDLALQIGLPPPLGARGIVNPSRE